MKFKANFQHKLSNFQMDDCRIEKVVELSAEEFSALVVMPLRDHPAVANNKDCMFSKDGVMHCLLALGEGQKDGVLIESEGYNFPRYAAYVPGMRDIVNAELERAVNFIVRQGVENTRDGSWIVHIDDLAKQLDLTVREGNGLDAMLLDALVRKPEISYVDLIGDCIAAEYHPRFCKHLRREEVSAQFSPERTAELFGNAMTAILQRHGGDELYAMLHDDFGLTLQEIRDHGYLTDPAPVEAGALPRQVLENVMCVRDILQVDTPCDAFLTCGPEHRSVPLEDLNKLTESGRREYAALLDAEVADIRSTDMGLELTLDGVRPEELDRFAEACEAHEWAEEHTTMYM